MNIEEDFVKSIHKQLPEFKYEIRSDGIDANLFKDKSLITLYFEKGKADKNELNFATSFKLRHEELYEYILKHNPNFKPKSTFSIRIGTLGTILNDASYRFEREKEIRRTILPINQTKLKSYIKVFSTLFKDKINPFISRFNHLEGYIDWYDNLLSDIDKTKWLVSWRDAYCHLGCLKILNRDTEIQKLKWESMIEEFDKENFQEFCKSMKINNH